MVAEQSFIHRNNTNNENVCLGIFVSLTLEGIVGIIIWF